MSEVATGTGIFSKIKSFAGEVAGFFGWRKALKGGTKSAEELGTGIISKHIPTQYLGKYALGKKLLGPIGVALFEIPDLYNASKNGNFLRQLGRSGIKVGLAAALSITPLGPIVGGIAGYAAGDMIANWLIPPEEDKNAKQTEQGQVTGIQTSLNPMASLTGYSQTQVPAEITAYNPYMQYVLATTPNSSIFGNYNIYSGTYPSTNSGLYSNMGTNMYSGALPSNYFRFSDSVKNYYSPSLMGTY